MQDTQHKHLLTRENKNEGNVAFNNLLNLLAVRLISGFFFDDDDDDNGT